MRGDCLVCTDPLWELQIRSKEGLDEALDHKLAYTVGFSDVDRNSKKCERKRWNLTKIQLSQCLFRFVCFGKILNSFFNLLEYKNEIL